MTPIPPACANAIAISDSVTVSIAAEIIGMLRFIVRVSLVESFTSAGRTELAAGSRSTSSKVNASDMLGAAIGDVPSRSYINHSRVSPFQINEEGVLTGVSTVVSNADMQKLLL